MDYCSLELQPKLLLLLLLLFTQLNSQSLNCEVCNLGFKRPLFAPKLLAPLTLFLFSGGLHQHSTVCGNTSKARISNCVCTHSIGQQFNCMDLMCHWVVLLGKKKKKRSGRKMREDYFFRLTPSIFSSSFLSPFLAANSSITLTCRRVKLDELSSLLPTSLTLF